MNKIISLNQCIILSIILLFGNKISNAQTTYNRNELQKFFMVQDFEGAIDYLKQFPNDTLNTQYSIDFGYSLYMSDKRKAALPYFLAAYKKEPDNLSANIYLADIYTYGRKPDSALHHNLNLVRIAPQNSRFWQQCGFGFSKLKMEDSAKLYFAKAYQLNPTNDFIVTSYADALIYHKQKDSAILIIDAFLKNDSTSIPVITQKVEISYKDNNFAEATFWGTKLKTLNALSINTCAYLAFSFLEIKKFDSCITVYQFAKQNDIDGESVTYCAALAYARKKLYAKSNELLDECLKKNIQPNAVDYFRSKADNLESSKLYKEAIAQYDSSYYIFHKPVDLYYKGRVYDIHLNNKTQALVFYKKYLRLAEKNPNSPAEKEILDYLNAYIKP